MRLHFPAIALLLTLSGCATNAGTSPTGLFRASDGSLVELHASPDGQIRGYLREGARVAALASVQRTGSTVHASATYDDGTSAHFMKEVKLIAAEKPADAAVRSEIEEAYRKLARAVETKDFDAFQMLRVAEFATIPPEGGAPSPAARMAERARGLLERIQPPIKTTNDILALTTRGDEAIATVRQKFTRQVSIDGKLHTVHTEVTQRETWRKTADGWKLTFVDEVRDSSRTQD